MTLRTSRSARENSNLSKSFNQLRQCGARFRVDRAAGAGDNRFCGGLPAAAEMKLRASGAIKNTHAVLGLHEVPGACHANRNIVIMSGPIAGCFGCDAETFSLGWIGGRS